MSLPGVVGKGLVSESDTESALGQSLSDNCVPLGCQIPGSSSGVSSKEVSFSEQSAR